MGSMNDGSMSTTVGSGGIRRSVNMPALSATDSSATRSSQSVTESSVADNSPPQSPVSSVADNSPSRLQSFNISPAAVIDEISSLFVPALTGTAKLGKEGLPRESVAILESKDSYLFRVGLAGVPQDNETFSWHIEPNGKLFIKGVTTTGEKPFHRHGMEFQRYTNNLGVPGDFSISFQLPGPVDPQGIQLGSGRYGVFEVLVKKAQP